MARGSNVVVEELVESAFASDEWRVALEAWYEALGVSVLTLDAPMRTVISQGPRAGFCDTVFEGASSDAGFDCITEDGSGFCKGGTPYRLVSLEFESRIVANFIICGYVTSAPDRRRVASRLSAYGLSSEDVRAIVRGIPVIPKRRLSAIEVMVAEQAHSLLDRYREQDLRRGAETTSEARQREVLELLHVAEIARTLHHGVEVRDIAPLVAGLLQKSLDFAVGGVALTGYGIDRVVVVAHEDISRSEIEEVAAEAVGRRPGEGWQIEVASYLSAATEGADPAREWTVLSEPLAVGGSIVGYLFASRPISNSFAAEDARLLKRLAPHVAVAFNRSSLFERLERDYSHAIEVLSAALDAGEGMQPGHTGRVMEYAERIGVEMGLAEEDVEVLRFAGLVHDIGKIGISGDVLGKPERLTQEEMAEVRRHSQIGASLLEQMTFLNAVTPVVLHHHEHWDGGGYPAEIAGEDIPLMSRILAVADAYASMCADTPYRRAFTPAAAEAEVHAGAGTLFDPRVVEALSAVLRKMETAGLSGMIASRTDQDVLPA